MRTTLFLVSGLLLMSSFLIVANLFSAHFPSAPNWGEQRSKVTEL